MKKIDLDTVLDRTVEKVFLWAIPKWMTPNFLTYLRIASVPFVYFLLIRGQMALGFVLFFLSVLTDLVDGTLARTRNQITTTGKVLDPIADKLLILSVLVYVGFDHPLVKYLSILIVLEAAAVIGGLIFAKQIGEPIGANTFGKVKMWFQTFGIFFFLIGTAASTPVLVQVSLVLLFIAFGFAIIAGVVQFKHRFISIKAHRKRLKD